MSKRTRALAKLEKYNTDLSAREGLTWHPEGLTRDLRRKPPRKSWSVKDDDHIPNGERVICTRQPSPEIVEKSEQVASMLRDKSGPAELTGYGTVRKRLRDGRFVVEIPHSPGSNHLFYVYVTRDLLVWPLVPNVLPLRPKRQGES